MKLTGNGFLKCYAISGNLLQILCWWLWLWICLRVLNVSQINPAAADSGLWVLWVTAAISSILMIADTVRVWRADPKRRRLWLTVLLRTVSLILFLYSVYWLFAPAIRQLYELEL